MKKREVFIIAIAVAALCLSVVNTCITVINSKPEAKDAQYVMFLGTNDKDTDEPVFSPDEAKLKAEEILIGHFGGYTIQDANGGWEYEGTRYQEYTIVIYLSDTTLEEVHAAADDLIRAFNQSSVLIQTNETVTEFYSSNG